MKTPKTIEELVVMISKLEPQEFLGVCKLLGIKLYEDEGSDEKLTGRTSTNLPTKDELIELTKDVQVRDAEILLDETIKALYSLNRVQRRNLKKILKPATKGR